MMTKSGGPGGGRRLDYWRNLFANTNIFDVIKNSILIAASDCPKEFEVQRDRIAQTLFTCRPARCLGCNKVELHLAGGDVEDEDCVFKDGSGEGGSEDIREEGVVSDGSGGKESKVNSSATDDLIGNCSYDEVEALTEEIMEENQIMTEVYRIKEILTNKTDESDAMLYESLRRIQLMRLSVEILEETEIGKVVNNLRRHRSKEIQHLVRTVIEEWKELVSDWVKVEPVRQEPTPESMNPTRFDDDSDYGLLSPPLDEGAFITAAHTTSMEFSKFFDGMDNDGNLLVNDEGKGGNLMGINSSLHQSRISEDGSGDYTRSRRLVGKQKRLQEADYGGSNQQKKGQEASVRTKPPKYNGGGNGGSGPSSMSEPKKRQNLSHCFASTPSIKSDKANLAKKVQKKPLMAPVENTMKSSDDNCVRTKIEVAKRRIQERYLEADNAKKQRTIRVLEFEDLPKRGLIRRPSQPKQGNTTKACDRHWTTA